MKNMKEFTDKVAKRLQDKLGEDVWVESAERHKLNGTKRYGVEIQQKGEPTIRPCFYVDHYRTNDDDYPKDIEEIVDEIYEQYKNECLNEMCKIKDKIGNNALMDFKKVKDKIRMKLVNTGWNREMLEDVPHKQFLDLSYIYYLDMGHNEGYYSSVTIRNVQLKTWQISEEELHQIALENTKKAEPDVLHPIYELLCETLGISTDDKEARSLENVETDCPMWVLTNRKRLHGATVLGYTNLLQELADKKGCDLIILPSSIHETIIIPEGMLDRGVTELRETVAMVNDEDLEEDEKLGENVYRFIRENGKIEIAA